MGKQRREKNKKILEKNRRKKIEETTVPWADLPQEILGIILGKLVSAVDVIRLRSVCKSWHIIDDIHRKYLPWLCNLSWSKKYPNLLECEMYDPYSRQVFVTSKLVESRMESRRYTSPFSNRIICLGSKQGWLIAAYSNHFIKWEIFMYNPYTKHFILLPFIWKHRPCVATFSGNPVSVSFNDCRVFLFVTDLKDDGYIASYVLHGNIEWEIESLIEGYNNVCCGMQYMHEQLFCIFRNGKMIRYNLADKSRTSIYLGNRLAMDNQRRLWLAQGEGEGDLLVVMGRKLGFDSSVCWSFRFDWSNMSFVGSDLQESSAVFISGHITTFVRPFEDKDEVENNNACKIYFFDEYFGKKGYCFPEMRKRIRLYSTAFGSSSTVFMEPPRMY